MMRWTRWDRLHALIRIVSSRRPPFGRQLCRPARLAADIDVGEMAFRRRLVRALGEDAEPVGHARAAEPLDAEADLDRLGIGERRGVAAAGLDDEADRIASRDVEQPGLDQPAVHRRVEPGVMDRCC